MTTVRGTGRDRPRNKFSLPNGAWGRQISTRFPKNKHRDHFREEYQARPTRTRLLKNQISTRASKQRIKSRQPGRHACMVVRSRWANGLQTATTYSTEAPGGPQTQAPANENTIRETRASNEVRNNQHGDRPRENPNSKTKNIMAQNPPQIPRPPTAQTPHQNIQRQVANANYNTKAIPPGQQSNNAATDPQSRPEMREVLPNGPFSVAGRRNY